MRRCEYCVSILAAVFVSGLAFACNADEMSSPKDVAGFNPSAETSVPAPLPAPGLSNTLFPTVRSPTDSQISAAVFKQFERDPGIDDRRVYVSTNDGIVQLVGRVNDILSKERLAPVAGTVRGVRAVSDRVVVVIPKRSDARIVGDVAETLQKNSVTAPLHLRESCSNGVVRLSGRVATFEQQESAERLAKGVRGVRAVDDDIKVASWMPRTDRVVTNDVVSRLEWDPLVHQSLISVETHHGTVFLGGEVGSIGELVRATSDAWGNGVDAVDTTGVGVDPALSDRSVRVTGVQPSDAEIARAVKDATVYDPRVKSIDVEPRVSGGTVTLLGIVDDEHARLAADSLAQHTVGVTRVRNLIHVRSEKPLTDLAKLERLESALATDTLTDRSDINIDVTGDTARLTGVVGSYMVRAEAGELAAGVAGFVNVDNRLYVERGR